MKFQERMHLEKIRLGSNLKWPPIGHYSLSNGRYLVIRARWLDHYYKTNVRFQERIHLEKFRLDQILNGRLSAIIHFHMADIW